MQLIYSYTTAINSLFLPSNRLFEPVIMAPISTSIVAGVIGNVISVVGIVIINKYITEKDGYNFMVFMSALHFGFTYYALKAMAFLGYLKAPTSSRMAVFPVAIGSLLSVAFMNLNLSHNSVGFYQLSKLACIPFTLLVQYIENRQTIPTNILLTLLPILFGVGYATVYDVSVNFYGTIIATLAIIATSVSQILTNKYQNHKKEEEEKLDALQLLYQTSPLTAIGMLVMCPFFDDMSALANYNYDLPCIKRIIITCILALGVNITNYSVIGSTSPLTYQVLGHLKTILIIILGFVVFSKPIDTRNLVGIVIAMTGVIAYTELKRQQNQPTTLPK